MEYTTLGKTDLRVSRICFGCWQLSPKFWGEVPLKPWSEAVSKAVEHGVNFFDTADVYGKGYSETELGRVLKENRLRDRIVLATKFYWNVEQDPRHPDTRREHILQACENSLRRLQTDCIDLYQIHAFDALTCPDVVASALLQLQREGKVRWFGVSNLNPEQMRMYGKYFQISCLQPPYSLLRREAESHELPYCLGEKIGVIPYSPLYRGLLTGKYSPDHKFNDSRKHDPLFTGRKFQHMLVAIKSLTPIADRYGLTLAQLAIRWVLTHPAITSPIVGIKDTEQILSILPAAEGRLSQADWYMIAGVISKAQQEEPKAIQALQEQRPSR